VSRTIGELGGLDILISNAGRQKSNESILDISTDDFDWTMKTNIYAPFWIIKTAIPHMRPGSCIIATTSEQAYEQKFGGQTPFGRAGMPGELAGIYVLLADNQASFATGQIYGSSGGAGQP
jgi:NAD(P)-dependent dehydrogenase (short-subunit alcohol dehydrogenase family)